MTSQLPQKYVSGIHFPIITLHVFVRDSEKYMKNCLGINFMENLISVTFSGKCKVLIFLRVWSFPSHAPCILSADDLGKISLGFIKIAQNRRRTKYTEHASKKIRPWKRLDLYILRTFKKVLRTNFAIISGRSVARYGARCMKTQCDC